MPAPLIVTLLTAMCPGILKVPSGIHTVPPAPAAWIAEVNAAVESAAPVGSAPLLVTLTEPLGWARAPATASKSAKSIVVELVAVKRNLVPAGYDVGNSRCVSS